MSKFTACLTVLLITFISSLAGPGPASARTMRLCMDGHWHFGSGNSAKSKRAALKAAVASWAGFVAFEYGTAYASFRRGADKGRKCLKENGTWFCSVQARPCRLVKRVKKRRA